MRARSSRTELVICLALCAGAVALRFAPADVRETVQATVRDALRPAQLAVLSAEKKIAREWQSRTTSGRSAAALEELRAELAASQTRCRQALIENSRLRAELGAVNKPGPVQARGAEPLIVPDLLEVWVLGEEAAALLRGGKLIDFGASDALSESALVLEDTRPLLDQGADTVEPGQALYSGRAVVGRVEKTGRWVSTLQHVTDSSYRGLAQIARHTPEGLVFGARGILAGCGEPLCRLTQISSTESVSAGDEVYTADEPFPEPMYYGRVTHAQLEPGGLRWDIRVEPAVPLDGLRTVQVLRRKVSRARLPAEEER